MNITADWESMFLLGTGTTHTVEVDGNPVDVEIVEAQPRITDYWGEAIEGENECHIVFNLDGRLFKRVGYQTSFSRQTYWDEEYVFEDSLFEVVPETQTVVSYKRKD